MPLPLLPGFLPFNSRASFLLTPATLQTLALVASPKLGLRQGVPMDLKLRLIAFRTKDARRYNVPTADEVTTLMVGDGSEAIDRHDVVLAQQARPFQRISELYVGYMALHYPLLFPYGEDGWHPNILLNGVVVDADLDEDHVGESELQRKHCNVIMAEFYGYRLQHRDIDGIALLWGDRLRHQYIMDVYAAIEQNHLKYLRLNKKKTSHGSLSRPSRRHCCR
jgi:hypothetical protein